MHVLKACFTHYSLLFAMLLASTAATAQDWRSGWVYIQNVETGLVLDVRGNVKTNGTPVWPYTLNYTQAQMFRFSSNRTPERFGERARYILAYDGSGLSSDYYLSAATAPGVFVEPSQDSNQPIQPQQNSSSGTLFVDPDRPVVDKTIYRQFLMTIEEKLVYEQEGFPSPGSSNAASIKPRQIWKVVPVENKTDTFYLQNAHFEDVTVLETLDRRAGGTAVLSSFTGSPIQQWRLVKTAPRPAVNPQLSDFKWKKKLVQKPLYKPWQWHYARTIEGKLSWDNNGANEVVKRSIRVTSDAKSYESITVAASESSVEFSLHSNDEAKTQSHCFSIRTVSQWPEQNVSFSERLCEEPNFDDESIQPPSMVGVKTLVVTNCHSQKETVRLWTYDFTENSQMWDDHGTLGSQWFNSSCPNQGEPKEIELTDGHNYRFLAIDCGDTPPDEVTVTCLKMTVDSLMGDDDGGKLMLQIF